MKKKGKMAACLILLVLLLAVLVVLTKKNSTADADSGSSDSGADAEKVVDFSKDDVTALSFQINGETVSFTETVKPAKLRHIEHFVTCLFPIHQFWYFFSTSQTNFIPRFRHKHSPFPARIS